MTMRESSEKASPPGYEEPESVSSELVSETAAQAEAAAAAAIEGHAAQVPSSSFEETGVVGEGERRAAEQQEYNRLSTIDSFYQYHTGLDEQASAEELNAPPPAYSDEWGHIQEESGGMGTNARVADDGRVNIRIEQRSRKISSLLVPALRQQLDNIREEGPPPPPYIPESLGGTPGTKLPPPLNIVIHVVGSRGDVQPFVALGKVLKDSYKHRIRLATHPNFKDFVEENGLEFFNIGGDPSELMAFMVKNPGLMPGFDAIRKGDIGKRRQGIGEIIKGCWRSCFEVGDGMGEPASDMTLRSTGGQEIKTAYLHAGAGKPFIAEAIIANPPSFAHVHCAERLGIPLHMMFTMPWSPTQAFPHPLANIQSSDADTSMTNFMSYALVDMLTWQGLGDIINRFRVHSLQLEPISLMWAPGMLSRLRVPWTYCWSPALIPKPKDWASHIKISGFYFLNLATNYTPAPDLLEFLQAGPPPVYIGFGSIVVDDPNALTKMIFEAVQKTGVRALVSKGWGGIGADELGIPDGVFMLGNVPHDWLFQHVSAVVHHGGAGTTAAGIAAGKPTFIVPFFGDQPFWGAMVARAGAGPKPIAYKQLTADNMAESIEFCLKQESQFQAKEMAAQISQEKGNEAGAESFHQMLPGGVDAMRCSITPELAAVWKVKKSNIRLSAVAAAILAEENILSFGDLKLFRANEYETDEGPWDPITGGASAVLGTVGSMMMGVADLPIETLKALRIHPDSRTGKSSPPKSETASTVTGPLTTPTPASASSTSLPPMSPARTSSEGASLRKTLTSSTSASTPSLEEQRTVTENENAFSPASPTRSPTSSSSFSVRRKPLSPGAISSDRTYSESSIIMTDNTTPVASPLTEPQDARKISVPDEQHRSLSSVFSHSRSRSGSGSRSDSRGQSPTGTSRTRDRAWTKGSAIKAMLQNDDYESDMHKKLDTVLGTGKGLQRIVGAGLKSPMDVSLALAKGFHNVPKLYGDDTIREVDKVTGMQSGLKTATKELGYGFYDGITGLVTQPIRGAKKSGAEGFIKGVGKGIAGLVVKPGAGIYGIPGYTMKGIYQEVQKKFGASVNNYIIASRTAQGYAALTETTREDRKEIVNRYLECQYEALRKRSTVDEHMDMVKEKWGQKMEKKKVAREARVAERREKGKGKERARDQDGGRDWGKDLTLLTQELAQKYREHHRTKRAELDGIPLEHTVSAPLSQETSNAPVSAAELESPSIQTPAELPGDQPHDDLPNHLHLQHAATYPLPEHTHHEASTSDVQAYYEDVETDEDELEEAIRLSVQQTSRGDEDEDEVIAKAIRASITALENEKRKSEADEDAIQAAVAASVAEAAKRPPEGVDEEEYERNLEEVLKKSVTEQSAKRERRMKSSDSEWDNSSDDYAATASDEEFKRAVDMSMMTPAPTRADDVDDDEELKKAMEESKLTPAPTREVESDDDEELKKIMEQSKSDAKKAEDEEEKRRKEEEIVMEYVKKQSLMEEELRRKRLQGVEDEWDLGEVGEASGTS